ncbi:MAG: hypothetical protein DCC67_20915 [Planctomycetota bacterium]|nr:MAG: hypothetical protein DCC67_20915 [Planctomycetota bacterium]
MHVQSHRTWACIATMFRAAALASALLAAAPAEGQTIGKDTLIAWGREAYDLSVAQLRVPGSSLFAESANLSGERFGGSGGFAFVWPASIQFRVLNALAELDPAAFANVQRSYSTELQSRYWRWTTSGGYRSGVPNGDLFYDDNAHLVVALADAYTLTGDPIFLSRARATYRFVERGENDAGGGGIYFKENDFGWKDAISTLQAARSATMLYRITGENGYLTDATRLYGWAADTLQWADGRFWEKLYLAGPKAGTLGDHAIVNSAGIGLSCNVELYKATGDGAYIAEAQRIADISVRSYFDPTTFRINDEGFWAFELVDGLIDLYEIDGNRRWRTAVERGLAWLHAHKRDANGHYGLFWGRGGDQTLPLESWNLIDQAPVARAYLSLALAQERLSGDFDRDGDVDGADLLQWQLQSGATTVPGLGADASSDGRVNAVDLAAWKNYFSSGLTAAASIPVPEPAPWPAAVGLASAARLWRRRVIGKRKAESRGRKAESGAAGCADCLAF